MATPLENQTSSSANQIRMMQIQLQIAKTHRRVMGLLYVEGDQEAQAQLAATDRIIQEKEYLLLGLQVGLIGNDQPLS